uniref:Exportin 7 n=1 Tax=Taeniopygia guttata TaxID=59729 RepID=A0A674H879_TAEGU
MADPVQSLAQLENLCKQLYETTDTGTRLQAEKALVEFTNSPECLSKCQLLLERGSSSYSQLLAATCLTKLVSRSSNALPLEQRLDIRNYVLNYLATRPKLATFVTQALIQLYARITKLGWFDCQKDEFVFRNVINDVTRFLQDSVEHCIIGVTILSQLTNEINQADTSHPLTKHRKIASSFRDSSLFDIFTLSCSLLKQASGKSLHLPDESQQGLLMQLLKLTHNCLSFDFIGTSTDESSDDLCTVQIPTSWRSAFLDSSTLQLFFDLYHSIPPSFSPLVLSCLVQIASVRRSLFNNAERAKFLSHLVDGVKRILENPQSLSDPNNYHEFCRLLARLKSNYQLGELVKVENYPEVIRLIANFTVTSLQHWEFAPNSVHYLLSLWQRLAASVPYVKATEPHMLETYTPEVTKAYITSRLESVHIILRDGLEDPLEDTGLVQQQLDQLSTIGRCEYEKTCALLVQLFDQAAQSYQELLQSASASPMDLAVQEGRLTWLVYIIGAVIGGRVSFASTDEQDAMDGELVCRVLQLMNLTDSRLAQAGNEKLELAMLSFFEQFRKIYIGDQVQKSSKLYRRLSEVLGLNDETMVLSVFIGKIITNLKYWGRCEPITSKTLQLLNDLSIGYSSVRKLVKLSAVQFMLNNHTSEHFSFLGINSQSSLSDMRCRTTFYTALGRLLMVDLGEDEDQYEQFMLPLTAAFEAVAQMFSTNSFNEQEAKRTLVGLVRDLRGIAFAFNAKTSFMMLFDYPSYLPILQRAIELWESHPDAGRGAQGAGVRAEAEGHLHLLLHAEGGAQRQLRQLRRLPTVRRRRAGQRAADLHQAAALHPAQRPAGLSQAEPILLFPAGSADPGPHELHRQPGAARHHVHPVLHLRGAHRARHDGVHGLLLLPGPHRHVPVQAALAQLQEEIDGAGAGERPLPAHHAAAPRDGAADALHGAEHHHLRGLPEPVVHVPAPARPHPAQREVLLGPAEQHRQQPAPGEAAGHAPLLREPHGGHRAQPAHQEPRQVHPEPLGVPEGSQRLHEELELRRQQQRHDELTAADPESQIPNPEFPGAGAAGAAHLGRCFPVGRAESSCRNSKVSVSSLFPFPARNVEPAAARPRKNLPCIKEKTNKQTKNQQKKKKKKKHVHFFITFWSKVYIEFQKNEMIKKKKLKKKKRQKKS